MTQQRSLQRFSTIELEKFDTIDRNVIELEQLSPIQTNVLKKDTKLAEVTGLISRLLPHNPENHAFNFPTDHKQLAFSAYSHFGILMNIYGTPSRKTAYASLSPLTMASNNIPSIKIVNNGGSFSIRSNLNTKTSQLITEQQQSSDIESRQRINKLASNPTIESEKETDSEFL
ncbi:hypothetical protein V1477_000124 [Vespula maculifrons]|uniref:Uncharacterized protein n=1 Tax=Vespula maculifrons TaxID=7453 RepID=A0ABD2D2M9_VESMC